MDRTVRATVLSFLVLAGLVSLPGLAAAQTNRLYAVSQAGDPVGHGLVYDIDLSEGGFSATRNVRNGVDVAVGNGSGGGFVLRFFGPRNATLVPGDYPLALFPPVFTLPFPPEWEVFAGLLVSQNAGGCGIAEGRFVVLEAEYDLSGTVTRFAADFEQHCNDLTPGLFGSIRYNSTISSHEPFGGNYPDYRIEIVPSAFGQVTGAGLTCGNGAPNCSVSFANAATVTLTATPNAGYAFLGWTGGCVGIETAPVKVHGRRLCTPHFASLAPGVPRTRAYFHVQSGYQFPRRSSTYFPGNSEWTFTRDTTRNRIHLLAMGEDGQDWYLDLRALPGQQLAPGTYGGARHPSAFTYTPTIDLGGCGDVSRGRFVIHEIAFTSASDIERLSVDFEEACGNGPVVLVGAVRFNTTSEELAPFGGSYPTYSLSIDPPAHGTVAGGGINCGNGGAACTVTPTAGSTIALTAIPSTGYVFAGWLGDCAGGAAVQVVVNRAKSCTARFEPSTVVQPRTFLWLHSEPGDRTGGGGVWTISDGAAYWEPVTAATNHVILRVRTNGDVWVLQFYAPPGSALVPGTYLNARHSALTPNLIVYGPSNCAPRTGRFVVHDIAISGGQLTRFSADFEQHCNDEDPALYGAVRYNVTTADIRPFAGVFPVYALDIASSANGRVTGGGLSCGNGASTCTVTSGSPTSVALTATPNAGFMFGGWTGECAGGASASVRVYGRKTCAAVFIPSIPPASRTTVLMTSDAGDPVGLGRPWTYSVPNANIAQTTVSDAGNGVSFILQGTDGAEWRFSFAAPQGQLLAIGTYGGAVRLSTRTTTPGMDVRSNPRSCSTLTGSFIVRELVVINGNELLSAAIDFLQHCTGQPRLTGSIRYNSTLPVAMLGQATTPVLLGQAARTSNGGWMPRNRARDDDYSVNHTLLLQWPAYNATSGEVHPAFGDVDGDGLNEVVLGLGRGGQGYIAILDDEAHGYALLRWIQVGWAPYNTANGAVFPAVGDLDGDGYAEIVAGLGQGGQGYLQVFGGANRSYAPQRWLQTDFPSWNGLNGETHPAVGDLNNDGQAEIVVGLGNGGGGWVLVLNDGSLQHSKQQWIRVPWAAFWTRSGATWPAIGDIDGNGTPELVLGLGAGGEGYLDVWSTGSAIQHREWLRVNWPDYNVLRCGETRPAIGKLGTAAPGVVVGLGTCTGVVGGWMAIIETALPSKPTLWRNDTDVPFRNSGAGMFPAVIPR